MANRKPVLGYPTLTDAVLALRAEGLDNDAIAERIDSTPVNVCRLISETRRRRPDRAGCAVEIPAAVIAGLGPPAEARGITVAALIVRLLDAAATDALADAILDDADP